MLMTINTVGTSVYDIDLDQTGRGTGRSFRTRYRTGIGRRSYFLSAPSCLDIDVFL